MSTHRASARYAKSLIGLSQEQKSLEAIKDDMLLFSKILVENRELALLLKNPIIPGYKKKKILNAVFGGKVQKLTIKAFELIVTKSREGILDEIAIEFIKEYNEIKGIAEATVSTPYTLNAEERKVITELVNKITGKVADLKETIDESLIGGFLLNTGDTQIDESVKSKLRKIQKALVA